MRKIHVAHSAASDNAMQNEPTMWKIKHVSGFNCNENFHYAKGEQNENLHLLHVFVGRQAQSYKGNPEELHNMLFEFRII